MSKLISALTIFIKKQRRTTNDMQKMKKIDKYRRESNSSWMKNLYVHFHDFLTCWIRNEQNSSNMKNLIEEKFDANRIDKTNSIINEQIMCECKSKRHSTHRMKNW
jgi:hypothetical protein